MTWKELMNKTKRTATKIAIMTMMKILTKSQRNPRRIRNNTRNPLTPLEVKRETRVKREELVRNQNASNSD